MKPAVLPECGAFSRISPARTKRSKLVVNQWQAKRFSMRAVVTNLRTFLASAPAVLPPERIGLQIPALPGDLPAIVVRLTLDEESPVTLGRFVRTGHGIVQHTGVIQV